MQALLSFDKAPPFAAPLRFFLTAPFFALLAGLLLVWEGPSLLVSRWTPGTLAATHLLTIGFMLQIMLGHGGHYSRADDYRIFDGCRAATLSCVEHQPHHPRT